VKKRYLLFILSLSITSNILAQNNIFLWPIKGVNSGKNILYKPQDYIDNELNFGSLFITANLRDTIVAPQSGIIKSFNYTYYKSLIYVTGIRHINNDSLSVNDFDIAYRKAWSKQNNLDSKYISISIGVQTKTGEMYYISGIRPIKYFKTGTKIKKGQTIGLLGYSYKKIDKPSIMFSRTLKGKPADPMEVFGLKSTFITAKTKHIDYLTFKHPVDSLKKDFLIFRNALEEGHPGIYDYTSKIVIDNLFDSIYNSYSKPLTSEEFRISLLPILKAIKDSHTSLYSKKYKITDKSKLPIRFGLKNNNLIVYTTIKGYEEFLNKKIKKINNEDIKKIIPKVKELLYGNDGFIQSHNKRLLLQYFDNFYKKFYHKKKGNKLTILFKDGSSKEFEYDFIENKKYNPRIKTPNNKRFSIKKINSNTGIVDINTFELFDTDIDSIGTFISDKSLKNLIFDVRDNLGGDEKAIQDIFAYIAQKPFKTTLYEKVNKKENYELLKNTLNYLPDEKLFENYKKSEKGYILSNDNFPVIYPNKKQHFDGNVYVLINEFSKSAATTFPALVYKFKRGKIIGRETGSTYYQLNALKFPIVYLKRTGLELYMPLIKVVFDKKGNSDIPWGRGVLPDIETQISFKDIIGKDDSVLNITLKTIKSKKASSEKRSNKIYFIIGGSLMLLLAFIFIIYRISLIEKNYR